MTLHPCRAWHVQSQDLGQSGAARLHQDPESTSPHPGAGPASPCRGKDARAPFLSLPQRLLFVNTHLCGLIWTSQQPGEKERDLYSLMDIEIEKIIKVKIEKEIMIWKAVPFERGEIPTHRTQLISLSLPPHDSSQAFLSRKRLKYE